MTVQSDGELYWPRVSVVIPTLNEARNLPYVFITGYGQQGLPEQYRQTPTLQKPFQMQDLKTTLGRAVGLG